MRLRHLRLVLIVFKLFPIFGLKSNEAEVEIANLELLNQNGIKDHEERCIVPHREMNCDEDIINKSVPNGAICFFMTGKGPDLICEDGQWIEVQTNSESEREKRTHEVCSTRRSRRRAWWRRTRRRRSSTDCYRPNHEPYFRNCPIGYLTFTAPSKKSSAKVTWTVPSATDVEDGTLSVTQTSRYINGAELLGSATGITYDVFYTSKDSKGAEALCKISIKVKVIYCSTPVAPSFGEISCSGTNYGHSCKYYCKEGYETAVKSIHCQSNGEWTNEVSLVCKGVTCSGEIPTISDGHYNCGDNTYGSTCFPVCDSGYSLSYNYPIICKSNGEWSVPINNICKDSEPPILSSCPSDVSVKADIGKTSAVVTWNVPTASDNQDSTSPRVEQTAGSLSPGDDVDSGVVHTVKYIAYDNAGNPSEECSFTVQVKVTSCMAISAPQNGHYECDKGFIYGSQCSYSCDEGYILQGNSVSTCGLDGTWDSIPSTCISIECLQPDHYGITISNGYYYCPSPVTYYSYCVPVCNDGFKLKQYMTALCTTDLDGNPTYSISIQPECLDNESPYFVDCEGTKVFTFSAEKGMTSSVIQYDIPVVNDNYDASPIVRKVTGPDIGDAIDANNIEYVEFQATDDAGNPSALCTYALKVDVSECNAYIPPSNGEVSCTADYIYGSICTLSCREGYENEGFSSAECLENGSWNVTGFECTKIMCPSPPVPPENGVFSCPSNIYEYNTICYASCNQGFSLSQWSYARCKADKTWEIAITPLCTDSEPPVFTYCNEEVTFQADSGIESTIVTWTIPSASDNVDNTPTVSKVSGPEPGDRIEGQATIKYQATDKAGNPSEICTMQITVEVIRCPSPQWPDDGSVTCDLDDIYGSECSYSCDEGYEISESTPVVCGQDSTWSYGSTPPSCSPISCGPPPSPSLGQYVCFDPFYHYQSICILECTSGYSTNTAVYASCQSTGEWSLSVNSSCKDITPPTILNCKTYQTFYADRGLDTAQATWIVPTAMDNADTQNDITIEQLSGPPIGSNISIGITIVDYRAVDTAANPSIATCSITINVEAVYCNAPKYFFDDTNLDFTCASYTWGAACVLSCPLQASLTLQGPTVITCEAQFSGNSHTTTWEFEGSVQPYCMAEVCPKNLSFPQNGVLSYYNDAQPLVFVFCNENYDLPYEFSGQIFCLDAGIWKPDTVPDCTRNRRPGLNLLPVEYYYSGDCSTEATIEAIKEKVLALLQEFIGTSVAPDCFVDSTCDFADLTVTCSSRRKKDTYANREKRQTSPVHVQFSLTITGNITNFDELLLFEDKLFEISDIVENAITVGRVFDLDGYGATTFSRADFSMIKCEGEGQILEGFKCKSCAAGTYLVEINGKQSCKECPIGTYMDHDSATACISCPIGTSTNTTAAKSIEMCMEFCQIGYSSLTKVEPCGPCSVGLYQDEVGQTSCKKCDIGQTSFKTGSQNCLDYDIALNGQNNEQITAFLNTSSTWDEISVLFWIARNNGSNFGLKMENDFVISLSENILMVSWSDETKNVTLPFTSSTTWFHLALTVSSSTFSVYFNGDLQSSQQIVSSLTVSANVLSELTFDSETDIRLSSLALYSHELTTDEVASHQSACDYDISKADFTLDNFISSIGEVQAEPSSCIAIDSCAENPCGEHLCTPTMSGFVCTCSRGYEGTNCEIPPNNCYQNDCKNGATCVSNIRNYTCECPDGYRGMLCQSPPVNGGWSAWTSWGQCNATCDGGLNQRSRVCDNPSPGHHGKQCVGDIEEHIVCNIDSCNAKDPCKSNPCGDHQCLESLNGFICKCNSSFTGDQCQTRVDHCEPNPCYNDGVCNNDADNFTCTCPEGESGELCEEDDEEISYWTSWSQCTVTCNGGVSNRTRVCQENLACGGQTESRLCNNVSCTVDHCVSSPCGTNKCVSGEEGFICICGVGFTGSTCGTPVDFCEQNECKNGQCNNTESGYECICDEGYSGHLCNIPRHVGGWGLWSEWSDCSATCGAGERQRRRLCDNPLPLPSGKTCEGETKETESCTAECYDACLSSPCDIKHSCVANSQGYKCSCKDGYTGSNCDIPPDFCVPNPCENSAECVSTTDGFKCKCVDGYNGTTCEIEPDESVWGTWSGWDSCSVSCGGGRQSRQRECKMGTKGDNCAGKEKEEGTCAEESCPSCPNLNRHYGMTKDCSTDDDITTCTMKCLDGYFPPNSTYSSDNWTIVYQCSPFSMFTWNITNENPTCSKGSSRPSVIRAYAALSVQPSISCDKSVNFEDGTSGLLSSQVCQGTRCSISAAVTKCSNRRRRQTDTGASEIKLTFEFDFGNNTATDTNETINWDAIEDELSPVTSNGEDWLSVEIDGITYKADSTNVSKEANVYCSSGYFLQDEHDICVGCSPGTMYDAVLGYCLSCPIGTYQELEAQSSCISCPEGNTTNGTGSYDHNDCFNSPDETGTDADNFNIAIIIGVCVCAALVAIFIVGGLAFRAKRPCIRNKVNDSSLYVNDGRGELREVGRTVFERQKTSDSLLSESNISFLFQDQ